ncbi:MAG: inositol monophosphatase family protein [Sphingomonadaceae bacterium]|nr:inositol monophosphatase family protein [Sphingomonadaceae bacterium]
MSFAAFASRLAEAAREVTLAAAERTVEDKSKGGSFDPVTDADREAELAMRALIEAEYPAHGINGEEHAARPARCAYQWSLDPIDGTRAFICGLPSWATLIALLEEGEPILGVIDAARLDELYLGDGKHAWLNGAPIRTSACRTLAEARLSTTDPFLFGAVEGMRFERLREKARVTRYGLDAYGYARLAAGQIDLVAESGLKPHDWQALVPVIRGAGGVVGDWQGGADLSAGQILAAATPELFAAAVAVLAD